MIKIRKAYRLPAETIKVIDQVMKEQELATETAALCYIVDEYREREERIQAVKEEEEKSSLVADKVTERLGSVLERIRLTSSIAEKNTALTMDAVNTMLYAVNADFLMRASGATMHEVLRESEQRYEERAAHNKQIYDNRYIGTDRKEQK